MSVELGILTGLQAAGKTTFYRERFAATHVHVSKDAWPNARKKEERLRAGRSVVVDNTNPTPSERLPLIAIGCAAGAHVTSYAFIASVQEVLSRNARREGRARIADAGDLHGREAAQTAGAGGGLRCALHGAADRVGIRRGRTRVARQSKVRLESIENVIVTTGNAAYPPLPIYSSRFDYL